MRDERSLVAVVDDDESVRESLPDLLREFGFAAEAFASAEAFLASELVGETRCLILTAQCRACRAFVSPSSARATARSCPRHPLQDSPGQESRWTSASTRMPGAS